MMQVIPQTREEKIAMYMKLSKGEIIAMLLTNQELVQALSHQHTHAPSLNTLGSGLRPVNWQGQWP